MLGTQIEAGDHLVFWAEPVLHVKHRKQSELCVLMNIMFCENSSLECIDLVLYMADWTAHSMRKDTDDDKVWVCKMNTDASVWVRTQNTFSYSVEGYPKKKKIQMRAQTWWKRLPSSNTVLKCNMGLLVILKAQELSYMLILLEPHKLKFGKHRFMNVRSTQLTLMQMRYILHSASSFN
jgi:hypothetical protein